MSFSALSREIRDLIYHALLCPSDGVRLHLNRERRMRLRREKAATITSHGYIDSEEDEDEEDEEEGLDSDRWGTSNSDASAVIPIPTAIFYVNRQIRQEATEVFYRFNRFTFDIDTHTALKFLEGLRPSSLRLISDIGFDSRSTAADDGDCTEYWEALCAFITRHMRVNSATIQVPRDQVYGADKTREARSSPNPEWYWWPAARLLTRSLMAGRIQKVRIGYSATLKIRALEEEARYVKLGQSQHENPLENLKSISYLRETQRREEHDRVCHEDKDLESALAEGRPHKFASLDALRADQQTRRHRLDFVVARENDPIGDVGTVLVLTRPTAT